MKRCRCLLGWPGLLPVPNSSWASTFPFERGRKETEARWASPYGPRRRGPVVCCWLCAAALPARKNCRNNCTSDQSCARKRSLAAWITTDQSYSYSALSTKYCQTSPKLTQVRDTRQIDAETSIMAVWRTSSIHPVKSLFRGVHVVFT